MTEKGHATLPCQYAERGESPGVWIGSGLAGTDGLKIGDPVTGADAGTVRVGLHPSPRSGSSSCKARTTDRDYQAVTRLGAPFKVYPATSPVSG